MLQEIDHLWADLVDKPGVFVAVDDTESFPLLDAEGKPRTVRANDSVQAEKALGVEPGFAWPRAYLRAFHHLVAKKALEAGDSVYDTISPSEYERLAREVYSGKELSEEAQRFEESTVWLRDPETLNVEYVANVLLVSPGGRRLAEVWAWREADEVLLGHFDPDGLKLYCDWKD